MIISLLKRLFSVDLYVRVYKNRFLITKLSGGGVETSFVPDQPFTTRRLLIGEFIPAETCLRRAVKEISGFRLFQPSTVMILHPMDMMEGGASSVEKKVFLDLTFGAGARDVIFWFGNELSATEASQLLKDVRSGKRTPS